MPDKRRHRGPHPADAEAFAPATWPTMRAAVADLSWLLSHGYAELSALKLVGDRYKLRERQRRAVMRCACSDESLARRRAHRVEVSALAGVPLLVDGYNVLTTVEAALAGGVVIAGRDSCYRDMASMHGTFRQVTQTRPALCMVGDYLAHLGTGRLTWLLDKPVSNSGRLRSTMLAAADEHGWPWEVELVNDPDPLLAASEQVIATADSIVLDRCRRWFNLARELIDTTFMDAFLVDLG